MHFNTLVNYFFLFFDTRGSFSLYCCNLIVCVCVNFLNLVLCLSVLVLVHFVVINRVRQTLLELSAIFQAIAWNYNAKYYTLIIFLYLHMD